MKRRSAAEPLFAVLCAAAAAAPLYAAPPDWLPHAHGSRATPAAALRAAVELRTIRVATPEERTRWPGEPLGHEQGEVPPEPALPPEKLGAAPPGGPMPASPLPVRAEHAVKALGDQLHSFEGISNTDWI